MGKARAYLNHGRWVADCPGLYCNSADLLTPGQSSYACVPGPGQSPEGFCMTVSVVEWPANPDELWNELQARPDPAARNWFPKGHDLAVRAGVPHGQTVKQLRDETAKHIGKR